MVLDTNAVLSALVFESPALAWLRDAWQQSLFVPVVSRPVVQELITVLGYGKFHLSKGDIDDLLSDYLPYCEEAHDVVARPEGAPMCRDPKDQIFLNLAHAAGVAVLVTGDADLIALAGKTKFAIESPREFRKRFAGRDV